MEACVMKNVTFIFMAGRLIGSWIWHLSCYTFIALSPRIAESTLSASFLKVKR